MKQVKAEKEAAIESAAYRLVAEKGYGATSMLSIAKAASASNQTLYRWYGDKAGLFRALVRRNAETVKSQLEAAITGDADVVGTLSAIAPVLLTMLVGERATSLNRAAAADITGELGMTIAESGRQTIVPLIAKIIESGIHAGDLSAPSAQQGAEWYLSLLVGDMQIRRVNRSLQEPTPSQVRERASYAIETFTRLTLRQTG